MSDSDQQPAGASPGPVAGLLAQPYLLLILAPLFWGGNLVAGLLAVGQINPTMLIVGRWAGAVFLLLFFALPHVRRDGPVLKRSLPVLAVYGILGFASFNMLMYGAAYFTAGVNASIEQAAIPVIVLLGNFIVFRVRAKPLQVLGLVLTVCGVVWVATHGDPTRIVALTVNIGDGMVLLACALYALYSLTLRYRPDVHWLSFMFVTAFFALITSIIFQIVFGGGLAVFISDLPDVTPLGWLCVIYVMVFPSIIAQLCYARGVSIVGPNRASIFINLLPVFGTILSVIILHEGLQPYHLFAAALVVAGIMLAEYAVRAPAVR